jgi:hypothetical protein|tara:strand:- start:53 stop:514 length:462 start_codon:yes stop_codon:yes gene_type:complete
MGKHVQIKTKRVMDIPKHLLKKLKLRKEADIKKEADEVEEARSMENVARFKKSLEIVDKIGKSIGEMREWASYTDEPKLYNPFPIDILTCSKEQMLQMLIHAYGTAQYLKDKLVDEDVKGKLLARIKAEGNLNHPDNAHLKKSIEDNELPLLI